MSIPSTPGVYFQEVKSNSKFHAQPSEQLEPVTTDANIQKEDKKYPHFITTIIKWGGNNK